MESNNQKISNGAKKIFLVEDDPAIVDIYSTMLKKAGFEVQKMSLGQDVILKIKDIEEGKEIKPDLVLLDLILPDMHGSEIMSKLRQSNATKNVKIFVLTNQEAVQREGEAAKGLSPDQFIIKANTTPTKLVEFIKKELP